MATQPLKYNPIVIDSYLANGGSFDIPLKRTQGVTSYSIILVTGNLSGGTSPAWTISSTNPLLTYVSLSADESPIYQGHTPMIQEANKLVNRKSPNGLVFEIDMSDRDYSKNGTLIADTEFPSFAFTQNTLSVTVPALSTITSGSPTGSSGTTLYLVENDIPRAITEATLQSGKLRKVVHLEFSTGLSNTGNNDLTNFIAQTGAYKSLLFYVNTGSSQSFSSGSNSVINYMDIIVNDTVTVSQDFWAVMQSNNLSMFGVTPDTGYAMKVFSETDNAYNISNVKAITSFNLKVNTTSAGYLTAFKVEYV